MSAQEKLKRNELMVLQQEEISNKKMIEMYQNSLNRLQVEELNIRSMLGHIQDVDLKSRTTTPLESSMVQGENVKELMEKYSGKTGVVMDEMQVNLRTLDLDSTPLIQRMLRDSQVYEEEEEEEAREEEAFDAN